jgi:hypothetical protein
MLKIMSRLVGLLLLALALAGAGAAAGDAAASASTARARGVQVETVMTASVAPTAVAVAGRPEAAERSCYVTPKAGVQAVIVRSHKSVHSTALAQLNHGQRAAAACTASKGTYSSKGCKKSNWWIQTTASTAASRGSAGTNSNGPPYRSSSQVRRRRVTYSGTAIPPSQSPCALSGQTLTNRDTLLPPTVR